MAKQSAYDIRLGENTSTLDLGLATELPLKSILSTADWNFACVHRHSEPVIQKWGNFCSSIVTKLSERANGDKPIRWYHKKLFNFCYEQYDKYGDYYRMIDSSYATIEEDQIMEIR